LKCNPIIKTLQRAPAIEALPGLLQSITVPLPETVALTKNKPSLSPPHAQGMNILPGGSFLNSHRIIDGLNGRCLERAGAGLTGAASKKERLI
jgi:hypothetical protein